jgi:Holliday junction DNA helicase RuvB
MDSLIGHEDTQKQLLIAIKSAKYRNKNIPHILFSGVAGCGKTTMGMEIAKAADVDFTPVSPDDLSDRESVMSVLDKLDHTNYNERGDRTGEISPTILFVDEIHRVPRKGQEILGIAMEKFMLESGKANKFYWIPYFTLVGATTDDGELSKPFREKFNMRFLFTTYSDGEIADILMSRATYLTVSEKAAMCIARRSRGVPRIAITLLNRCSDYALFTGKTKIDYATVKENFDLMKIDSRGLTEAEIKILKILYNSEEPIGVDNLAIISNESKKNLLNTIEPFLIRSGLIVRSGKGRIITSDGKLHLEQGGYAETQRNKIEIAPDYIRR